MRKQNPGAFIQGCRSYRSCEFTPMANPKKIMAKAWDNRYGVGLALELVEALHKEKLPNTLYAGATVQEELGLRGARTAANLIGSLISSLHLTVARRMI